ncbi:hypothetical protein CONCODRAFT_71098 [Conidiobolus coronatus NRRL 28638]|uniref:Arrestin C-terminal-like domain-containing protein n=1 Tax=Conidiobolus coronatus (strain ATCC 28846 / CBS 209.66 / NRRL 28638) TaxID=796925 RepID=A0A137P4R4_CONC2|nr:hypothetical protein CONCODRAFT_71098 [Conidiobolus coronatus NRRL 28638]|eukprot:KXN69939.1 hypothetical protein CONCODRAFT_71098 [Conidiobolus coronatus NRRL 28638]
MLCYKPRYTINLNLDKDTIFFNGSAKESESVKLQGTLEVSAPSNYRYSSTFPINLSFECNLGIKSKDLFYPNHTQTLFKLNWTFNCNFETQNNLKFPFEIKLPGNLPASLNLDDLKVSYKFRAYEECPLLQYTVMTKDISVFRLSRIPRPEYVFTHANTPADLTKAKGKIGDSCRYTLNYPMMWYDMDKEMPIKLRLTLNSDQRVHSVIYSIRQTAKLEMDQVDDLGLKSKYQYQLNTQDAYLIPSNLNEISSQLEGALRNSADSNSLISFELKSNISPYSKAQKKFANFSSNNDEVKIFHYLLVQVAITEGANSEELVSEVIRVPITILPRPKFDLSLSPPAYEEVVSR